MARSYSARELYSVYSRDMVFQTIRERIKKANDDLMPLLDAIEQGVPMRGDKANAAILKRNVEFLESALELIEKNEDKILKGDLSVFDPAIKKADVSGKGTAQAYLYSVLYKAGIGKDGKFSEAQLDDAWKKYGDGKTRETYIVLDNQGRRVVGVTGSGSKVSASVWGKLFNVTNDMALWGMRDWHNHPLNDGRVIGGPPSESDIQSTISNGVFEATIDSVEGRYRMTMTEKMKERLLNASDDKQVEKIANDAAKHWRSVMAVLTNKLGNGWSTDLQKGKTFVAALNEYVKANGDRLAAATGMKYEFVPRDGFKEMGSV